MSKAKTTNAKAKAGVSLPVQSKVFDALEAVVAEAREEFKAQQVEAAAEWEKDFARLKEEEEYAYKLQVRDRNEQLDREIAERTMAVAAREDAVNKSWTEFGETTARIKELEDKVAAIPAIIAKAEAVSFNKGQEAAKAEAANAVRIAEAESAAELKILNHALLAARGAVDAHEATIASLREELKAANERVQKIASEAVTSAGQSRVTVNASQAK